MPLDVLYRTQATLMGSKSVYSYLKGLGKLVKLRCARDELLQLLILNEKFLVITVHYTAFIMTLRYVHTACCTHRMISLVKIKYLSINL